MMMRRMATAVSILAAGLLAMLLVLPQSAAKKAPKSVVLKACKDKKPPVKFDHAAHQKIVKKAGKDCKTCHHNGDAKKGPTGKDTTCASCHLKVQKNIGTCKDKSASKNPFHVSCIGCHKKMKEEAKKAPTKCKECHK
jgi:hypothetical protein